MRTAENVVLLHQETIYELIDTYLGKLTPLTCRAYKKDIESFFRYLRNKDLQQLTREDIKVTNAEVTSYQTHLRKLYNNLTVNRKLAGVKGLYKFFSANIGGSDFQTKDGIDLLRAVKVDYLKKAKANSYGILAYDEYLRILDALKSQHKAEEKSLFMQVGYFTSYRITALRNLTWECFEPDGDGNYYVKTIDKGDKETDNGIPGWLYNKLRDTLYNEHDPKGEKQRVFMLEAKTINKALKKACDDVGINHKKRNIVFHSIKKLGVNETYERTGDIYVASQQGQHNNVDTTAQVYVKKKRKLGDMPLIRTDQPIDTSALHTMTRDELIALIESADNYTKSRLLKGLGK